MTEKYKAMNISTEAGERIVTTPEEAKKVISASAMTWCLTEEEARKDIPLFKELSEAMGLDLTNLVSVPNINEEDYPNRFEWVSSKKFIKKPMEVLAWQFSVTEDTPEWLEAHIGKGLVSRVTECNTDHEYLIIHKKEGNLVVNQGDFVIQGLNDELYPCEESIFYKTYEEVK